MIIGKTYEEKRKQRFKKHNGPWFAWYPVKIRDGRRVWLQNVFRYLIFPDSKHSWHEYSLTELESLS